MSRSDQDAVAAEPASFDLEPLTDKVPTVEPTVTSQATAIEDLEAPLLETPPASDFERVNVEPAVEPVATPAAAEPAISATTTEPAAVPSIESSPEPAEVVARPAAAEAPAAAAEAPAAEAGNGSGPLSDDDIERIARRVAELVGEKALRDVAWEVLPDLAEVVIKERIRELESQVV